MITRQIAATVRQRLASGVPAAVLLGPRQVGKTTLARQLAAEWPHGSVYLDLELPSDRRRLEDPEAYLRAQAPKLVVIDEIHRVPELFAVLRGLIDERRAAGQRFGHFLLLGSAAMALMQQSSETLAGRVAYLDMHAINLSEALQTGLTESELWNRGGFPDSLLARDDEHSMAWRQDFIRSYLERDVPMFAPRMPAETLGRLWTMLAHQQGSQLNQAQLAGSLGVGASTVGRYIDLLTDLHLVRRLQPWFANVGKRLVKTPKVFVRDSGLVHALLGLKDENDVLGHPVAGASYEGFVLETLITQAGPSLKPYFYRTHDGAEIDLLFERGGKADIAIEVKRSSAPSPERGFKHACDDLGIEKRFVVYPGSESFSLRHGAKATGLKGMLDLLNSA